MSADQVTRALADYTARLGFDDIPLDAVSAAKRSLLHAIACAFAGFRTRDAEILRGLVREAGGSPEATVLVSGEETSALAAALVNAHSIAAGAAGAGGGGSRRTSGPAAGIVPAALALGEREGRSGRDLVAGIVLGLELQTRFLEAAPSSAATGAWHPTTFTGFVAPLVAGKMLDLSVDQLVNAVGISGSRSGALGAASEGPPTMTRAVLDALAAQGGVFSALLAERGFTGPEHVIDGKGGLVEAIRDEWRPAALTDGLGDSYRFIEGGAGGTAAAGAPTDVAIAEKFASLAHGILSAERRGEILAAVEEIESVDNVIEFAELLGAEHAARG
jgi:2-methylcitrate dehydratase